MNKFFLSILLLTSAVTLTRAQNVGIETNNPQSKLDVNGDLALRAGSITLSGSISDNIDLAANAYSFYNVQGAGTQSIAGLAGGKDGRIITLHNSGSNTINFLHMASSLRLNSIEIPGGSSFSLLSGGSVTLVYNKVSLRWNIVSSAFASNQPGMQWGTDGNAGTNSGRNFIGTTDSADLVIKTAGTEQMRITNKGRIGIGTAAPQTDLHINPNGAGAVLIGNNRSGGGFTNLEMGISKQSDGYGYVQATKASGASYGSLALNPNGGRVGVGTNTPIAALDVKGGIALPIKVVTGTSYTVQSTDYTIVVDMEEDRNKIFTVYMPIQYVNDGRIIKIVARNMPEVSLVPLWDAPGKIRIYDLQDNTIGELYSVAQKSSNKDIRLDRNVTSMFVDYRKSVTLQCISTAGWMITDMWAMNYYFTYIN